MSVCRICLGIRPRRHITELKILTQKHAESKSYTEILLFCLGIQVDKNNFQKKTTKLCTKCFKKVIEFYHFKALALKNDVYLRSTLNDINTFTHEPKDETSETDVKTEVELVNFNETVDNSFESDAKDSEHEIIIKEELKDESDDELLSVIQNIKYEFIQGKEEKENGMPFNSDDKRQELLNTQKLHVKKQRGRPKKVKIPKSSREMKLGPMKVCEECGKYVRNLTEHAETHLPKELRRKFKCDICDKLFSSAHSKYVHKRRKHFSHKMKCPICDKMVLHLKLHEKIHNPDELKFECAPCGRRFVNKSRLDLHVSVHTKDKPFECDVCGSKFRLKMTMLLHKRQVHDKERSHLCQYCSKSFFKKHHLTLHLRSHTKEKPHSCPKCQKCFSSTTILKNHMLIHSEDKKYACTICDMSFVRDGYLKAHMLSHTKEKRFPCQYCGVRFHRSDHRKRHEFTAHLKHATAATAT